MKTNIAEITEIVLARLDESPEVLADAVEYGSESFDLRELFLILLPSCAERVLLESDLAEVSEWYPLEGNVLSDPGVSMRAFLPLPEDYFRLLYLRMSDWPEAETRVMSVGRETASLREYWDSRPGFRRRVHPAVNTGYREGKRVLIIYGTVRGARLAEGGYLPRPREDGAGNLLFPPSLAGELIDETVRTIKKIRE